MANFSGSPNILSGGFPLSSGGSTIVDGPGFSTDNALVRWNGTTGNLVQNGVITEDDFTGTLNGPLNNATTTAAGSAFTNQPANDGIEVLSSDAGDTTQTVTIIGTTNGVNTVVVETVTLTGTTPVATVKTDWGIVLAVKKSAATLGTVTVREASADQTITAGLTAAVLSVGVNTVSTTAAYNRTVSIVASGATTKQLGLGGTDSSSAQIYDSVALTGATALLSNSAFLTLTEIYTGDVEATRTATVTATGTLSINTGTLNLTGATFSVPDAFNISGAGSIGLTAGGSNKSVTLTGADAASTGATSFKFTPSATSPVGVPTWGISHQQTGANTYSTIGSFIYTNSLAVGFNLFAGGVAAGTSASPATSAVTQTVASFVGYGYANGAWKGLGGLQSSTSATWSDSDFSSNNFFYATNGAGTNTGISLYGKTGSTVFTGPGASTTDNAGEFSFVPASRSASAWGTTGAIATFKAATITDSSTVGSGTAASAVFHSWAAPTLAATNSLVTTTDAFVGLFTGPVANGTNQTITRKHTLGIVDSTSAASAITGGLIVATTVGTAATSVGIGGGNVNAGGSVVSGGVATVSGSTATPAAGSTSAVLLFGTTAGFGIYYGSNAPTVSAAQGSIYLRSDGSGIANRLYVNTTGSTTWTNFVTAA